MPMMSKYILLLLLFISFIMFSPVSSVRATSPGGITDAESSAMIKRVSASPKAKLAKGKISALAEGYKNVRVIVRTRTPDTLPRITSKQLSSVIEKRNYRNQKKAFNLKIAERISPGSVKIRKHFSYTDGFAAEVNASGLAGLIEDNDVVTIYEDRIRKPMLMQTNAITQSSQPRRIFGGEGIAVAIIDTGIDYRHPLLGGPGFPNSKVIGGWDTGEDDSDPMDKKGHGTAVAGILAGNIPENSIGDYSGGVAPDAKIYGLKVSDSDGDMYDSAIIEAIEWAIDNRDNDPLNPIKIINISLGAGEYTGTCDLDSYESLFVPIIRSANRAGISVFAASGNEGFSDAMSSPACLSQVISVGEVYDGGYGSYLYHDIPSGNCSNDTTSSDIVICYSNSSTELDLLAPGYLVHTTDILSDEGYTTGDWTENFSGTSAAAPTAAGAAAVLQALASQYQGEFLAPENLLNVLVSGGTPVTDERNLLVTPRVDLFASAKSLIKEGDINIDVNIDSKDAILALQLISGEGISESITTLGDFGGNLQISAEDAVHALQVQAEVCTYHHAEFCSTELTCLDNSHYWFGMKCNSDPCDGEHLYLCPEQIICEEYEGYWEESCYSLESESNSSVEDANLIKYDQLLFADISTMNDKDWYILQGGEEKTAVFQLSSLHSNKEKTLILKIYDANHSLITELNAGENGYESYVIDGQVFLVDLPASAAYYLEVSSNYQYFSESNWVGYRLLATELKLIRFDQPIEDAILSEYISVGAMEQDWYLLETEDPVNATISITSTTPETLWGVYIHDEADNLMGGCKLEHGEECYVSLPGQAKFFVTVNNIARPLPNNGAEYRLTISSNDSQQVPPLEQEPNNILEDASVLPFDTPVLGLILSVYDNDWFIIHNDAPRTVTLLLQANEYFSGLDISVLDSAGNVIGFLRSEDREEEHEDEEIIFNVNFNTVGCYFIKLTNNIEYRDRMTNYSLTAYSNDDNPNPPYAEIEQNNDKSEATTIVFDSPITGTTHWNYEPDWFVITNDSSRTATIKFESLLTHKEWNIKVYNTDDILLTEMNLGGGDTLPFKLPTAGSYYLEVSRNSEITSQSLLGYEYQLTVISNDGAEVPDGETETNGQRDTADQLAANTPMVGVNTSDSDEDWFVFESNTDQIIEVRFSADCNYGEWLIEVYNEDGTPFFDIPGKDSTRFFLQTAASQNIYIRITSSSERPYSEYQLTVTPNSLVGLESEDNNSIESGDVVDFSYPVLAKYSATDDIDWYTFNIDSPQSVALNFSKYSDLASYMLSVYTPDGELLLTEYTGTVFSKSYVYSLEEAGEYSFSISGHDSNTSGDFYTFELLLQGELVVPPREAEDSSFVNPNLITVGSSISGTLDPIDSDYFSFTVESAQSVNIKVSTYNGDLESNWRIHILDSSNDEILFWESQDFQEGIDLDIPEPGTYYVKIQWYYKVINPRGDYLLTVRPGDTN